MIGPGINGFDADAGQAPALRLGSRQEAAGRGRLPERLRSDHELPERPLRERRRRSARPWPPTWRAIGVKINLQAETKGTYFPKILRRDTSFYMLGWTPTHLRRAQRAECADGLPGRQTGAGQFNLGAYCNPKVDELTKKIQSETDKAKRDADDQGGVQASTPTTSATCRCTSRRWPGA